LNFASAPASTALTPIKSARKKTHLELRKGTVGGSGSGGAETGDPVHKPSTIFPCTEFTETKFGSSVLNTGPELVKLNVLPRSPIALAALPMTGGKFGKMNAPGLMDIAVRRVRFVLVGTLSKGPTTRVPSKEDWPCGQTPPRTPSAKKKDGICTVRNPLTVWLPSLKLSDKLEVATLVVPDTDMDPLRCICKKTPFSVPVPVNTTSSMVEIAVATPCALVSLLGSVTE
jgi:hypothetical protein